MINEFPQPRREIYLYHTTHCKSSQGKPKRKTKKQQRWIDFLPNRKYEDSVEAEIRNQMQKLNRVNRPLLKSMRVERKSRFQKKKQKEKRKKNSKEILITTLFYLTGNTKNQ